MGSRLSIILASSVRIVSYCSSLSSIRFVHDIHVPPVSPFVSYVVCSFSTVR